MSDRRPLPPTRILSPKVQNFQTVATGRRGDTYEIFLRSEATGAVYKLRVSEPFSIEEMRPLDTDRFRQLVSGDFEQIAVFAVEKRWEFSRPAKFLIVRFSTSELKIDDAA